VSGQEKSREICRFSGFCCLLKERRMGRQPTLKLHKMPAQIADPMTPEELQAIACIKRKFVESSF